MDDQWLDSSEARGLIENHANERVKGRDMSTIIAEMRGRGFQEDVIRELVIAIDDEATRIQLRDAEMPRAQAHVAIGAVLLAIGVGLTAGVTFWLNSGNGGYLLCYGAILSGAYMVWQGWSVRKRLTGEAAAPRRRIFRSRLR